MVKETITKCSPMEVEKEQTLTTCQVNSKYKLTITKDGINWDFISMQDEIDEKIGNRQITLADEKL